MADSFLKAAHVKRTRHAHQVTCSALLILLHDSYDVYHEEEQDPIPFEDWCMKRAEASPHQFQYWFLIMQLEQLRPRVCQIPTGGKLFTLPSFHNYIGSMVLRPRPHALCAMAANPHTRHGHVGETTSRGSKTVWSRRFHRTQDEASILSSSYWSRTRAKIITNVIPDKLANSCLLWACTIMYILYYRQESVILLCRIKHLVYDGILPCWCVVMLDLIIQLTISLVLVHFIYSIGFSVYENIENDTLFMFQRHFVTKILLFIGGHLGLLLLSNILHNFVYFYCVPHMWKPMCRHQNHLPSSILSKVIADFPFGRLGTAAILDLRKLVHFINSFVVGMHSAHMKT